MNASGRGFAMREWCFKILSKMYHLRGTNLSIIASGVARLLIYYLADKIKNECVNLHCSAN